MPKAFASVRSVKFTRDNPTKMATLEDIKAGARLRGLDAAGVAEIVQVKPGAVQTGRA